MAVNVSDIVASALAYANKENASNSKWVTDSTTYLWLNIEWRRLYRDLLRLSAIPPLYAEETVTATGADSYALSAAMLAVVGVAVVDGTSVRELTPDQGELGQYGKWRGDVTGDATKYQLYGTGTALRIAFYPSPASGTYTVRYVAPAATLTSASTIDVLPCVEDRLALGLAKRFLMKEQTSSRVLEDFIQQADEEIAMQYLNRGVGGIRVRNTYRTNRGQRGNDNEPLLSDRPNWWWF